MSNLYNKLKEHLGHEIEVVSYGGDENIAVECLDCCEVLVDANQDDTDEEN